MPEEPMSERVKDDRDSVASSHSSSSSGKLVLFGSEGRTLGT